MTKITGDSVHFPHRFLPKKVQKSSPQNKKARYEEVTGDEHEASFYSIQNWKKNNPLLKGTNIPLFTYTDAIVSRR